MPAVRRVELPIRGTRSATAPITWSQASLAGSMRATDKAFNVGRTVPLKGVATEPEVLAAVALLVERHETLRTTFRIFDEVGGQQQVSKSGLLTVEVHEAAESPAEEVADTTLRTGLAAPFAPDCGWPVRFCLILDGAGPAFLVVVAAHLAVDWLGLDVLVADFWAALDGTAALAARPAPAHPIDRAAYEAGEIGSRANARALEYWRSQLSGVSQSVFAVPAGPAAQPRWQRGCLDTVAGAAAVTGMLTSGLRATAPSLVVAAFAAFAAHYAHAQRFSCLSVVANRNPRDTGGYVGTLAQNVIVSFDVDLEVDTFHQLANRAFRAAMQGIRNGAFDRDRQYGIGMEVSAQRGVDLRFGYYNFIHDPSCRADLEWDRHNASLAELRRHSRFRWLEGAEEETISFYLAVRHSDSMLQLSLLGDTVMLPPAIIQQGLTGIESLLIEAATHDFPLAEVPGLTGVESLPLPSDAYRIDGSLISLQKVRRALEAVAGVRRAGVFVTRDNGGGEHIVAYLAGERDPIHPAQVHAGLLSALAGESMVIAPQEYVICADLPAEDDAGIERWDEQRILARGTGRALVQTSDG